MYYKDTQGIAVLSLNRQQWLNLFTILKEANAKNLVKILGFDFKSSFLNIRSSFYVNYYDIIRIFVPKLEQDGKKGRIAL